jgi:hypothetical protein
MTIALNIISAVIVFTGVVGMLAYHVLAAHRGGHSHTPREVHPVTARNRVVARQRNRRVYGRLESANA